MIRIDVNVGEIQKRLNIFRQRLKDMSPMMREVADIMYDSTMENFKVGGRPEWVKSQRAERDNGQTLVDTNALRSSVHKQYGSRYAVTGTNKVYAAIHQFGGSIMRRQVAATSDFRPYDGRPTVLSKWDTGEMPARPFFNLQPDELKDIEQTAVKYMGDK